MIPVSCLIALAKTFKTPFISNGESECLFLVLDLSGNDANFATVYMLLVIGLSYIALVLLRCVPSILILRKVLVMNGCCILSNAFSTPPEIITVFNYLIC